MSAQDEQINTDYDEELDTLGDIQNKEGSDFFDDVSEFSKEERKELGDKTEEITKNKLEKQDPFAIAALTELGAAALRGDNINEFKSVVDLFGGEKAVIGYAVKQIQKKMDDFLEGGGNLTDEKLKNAFKGSMREKVIDYLKDNPPVIHGEKREEYFTVFQTIEELDFKKDITAEEKKIVKPLMSFARNRNSTRYRMQNFIVNLRDKCNNDTNLMREVVSKIKDDKKTGEIFGTYNEGAKNEKKLDIIIKHIMKEETKELKKLKEKISKLNVDKQDMFKNILNEKKNDLNTVKILLKITDEFKSGKLNGLDEDELEKLYEIYSTEEVQEYGLFGGGKQLLRKKDKEKFLKLLDDSNLGLEGTKNLVKFLYYIRNSKKAIEKFGISAEGSWNIDQKFVFSLLSKDSGKDLFNKDCDLKELLETYNKNHTSVGDFLIKIKEKGENIVNNVVGVVNKGEEFVQETYNNGKAYVKEKVNNSEKHISGTVNKVFHKNKDINKGDNLKIPINENETNSSDIVYSEKPDEVSFQGEEPYKQIQQQTEDISIQNQTEKIISNLPKLNNTEVRIESFPPETRQKISSPKFYNIISNTETYIPEEKQEQIIGQETEKAQNGAIVENAVNVISKNLGIKVSTDGKTLDKIMDKQKIKMNGSVVEFKGKTKTGETIRLKYDLKSGKLKIKSKMNVDITNGIVGQGREEVDIMSLDDMKNKLLKPEDALSTAFNITDYGYKLKNGSFKNINSVLKIRLKNAQKAIEKNTKKSLFIQKLGKIDPDFVPNIKNGSQITQNENPKKFQLLKMFNNTIEDRGETKANQLLDMMDIFINKINDKATRENSPLLRELFKRREKTILGNLDLQDNHTLGLLSLKKFQKIEGGETFFKVDKMTKLINNLGNQGFKRAEEELLEKIIPGIVSKEKGKQSFGLNIQGKTLQGGFERNSVKMAA